MPTILSPVPQLTSHLVSWTVPGRDVGDAERVDEEAEALVCVELNAEEDRCASRVAGVDHPTSGVFNGSEQEVMEVRAALNSVHFTEHAARERFVLHSASVVSQLHGMSVPDVMLIVTILSRARARVAAREVR